jgi:hypothetical protein
MPGLSRLVATCGLVSRADSDGGGGDYDCGGISAAAFGTRENDERKAVATRLPAGAGPGYAQARLERFKKRRSRRSDEAD